MATIRAGGEAWVAGMTWMPRLSGRKLRRAARDTGAVAYVDIVTRTVEHENPRDRRGAGDRVETDTMTGLAGQEDGDPTGTPSLAAALMDTLEDVTWIAVVDGGDGRIAMIRCEAGTIDEDGDIVVDDATEAARRLEVMRGGFRIHASPSLGIPEAAVLDVSRIETRESHRLQPLPDPPGGGLASVIAAVTILVLLGGAGGAAWIWRQDIMDLIWPPEPEPAVEVQQERQVVTMISTPALLAACARALREVPPELPAWTLEEATCRAELVESPVLEAVPELSGRPALVLRWSLDADHDAAMHRRLLEDLLPSTRHAGIVHGEEAWAVTVLGSVIVEVDPDHHRPEFRNIRAALDRRVGPWSDSLSYTQLQPGQWSITITGRGPLGRLARALEPVAGLEVTSLTRTANHAWQVVARPLAPRMILESAYLRLSQPAAGLYETAAGMPEGGG